MEPGSEHTRIAWQPLTAPGVAAFAHAPTPRLWLVQLVFAGLAAGAVGWFLATAWFPVVTQAVREMPPEGRIQSGSLEWQGSAPRLLAENRWLSIAVDLAHQGEARSPAHVHVEFGGQNVKCFSILGYVEVGYPRGRTIGFNRRQLEPWWGAWAPPILAIAIGGVIASLYVVWALLAAAYCVPVWLLGFFADRDLDLKRSWRLAGAALMPGALFFSVSVVLYGLGLLDLPRLALTFVVHLIIGWGYVLVSPFYAPRATGARPLGRNPFHAPVPGARDD